MWRIRNSKDICERKPFSILHSSAHIYSYPTKHGGKLKNKQQPKHTHTLTSIYNYSCASYVACVCVYVRTFWLLLQNGQRLQLNALLLCGNFAVFMQLHKCRIIYFSKNTQANQHTHLWRCLCVCVCCSAF